MSGFPRYEMSPELVALIAEWQARRDKMTPDERRAEDLYWMERQRESWIRAFAPCEHGDPDWETCAQCLAEFAARKE